MESVYILELIARYEEELEKHEQGRYSKNRAHDSCPERLMNTIELLETELDKNIADKQMPDEPYKTARGDELESARILAKLANQLDAIGDNKEAEIARDKAQHIVASELNELDGFSR